MDELEQPIKTIQNWQEWYRKNKVVAEMDTPLTSKYSRENLHDTSQAVKDLNEALSPANMRTQAFNDLSDVIATYIDSLGGKELYKIFFEAAHEYMVNIEIEHKKINDLVERLRYRTKG